MLHHRNELLSRIHSEALNCKCCGREITWFSTTQVRKIERHQDAVEYIKTYESEGVELCNRCRKILGHDIIAPRGG